MGAKPRGSQDSPWLHFGLADWNGPVRVTVDWPSGANDTYAIYPVDRHVVLVEGEGAIPSAGVKTWETYE